jgi:hypothetical protein
MNINATLIIQIFNFLIVYGMLRLLLFKPVVAIIDRETAQENALHDIIDQQKKSLDIQEKERQRNWFTCREYFAINQPNLSQKKQFIADTPEDEAEITSTVLTDNLAHTVAQVRTALEEKIKHVH